MKELKELRFNETDILLQDNLVRGSILPQKVAELNRNIIFKGNNVVEGPIYGHRIEIQQGDLEVQGAVFSQLELYVNSEAKGTVEFKKCVGSANSIVSRAANCRIIFNSDVNAKSVSLHNAFVAGSIYADEVTLDNCVVIGGVFATQNVELTNSIVGTFNTPQISISGVVNLLLPSAFSIERINATANAKMYNLSLADLGSLYRGMPESEKSGRIEINSSIDEVTSKLVDDQVQKTLRSYTVVGKVLAADLVDTDKFQNHFLLTAASLGPQLLRTYDMGVDKDGNVASLEIGKIRDFFFDILSGKIQIKDMDGKFSFADIVANN
ncbi:MAG: hypothetical protein J6U69_01560 [Alistipes sp.]|jgi:hypothetical protein|nr:hypothetical protein [Alistipes sp.]